MASIIKNQLIKHLSKFARNLKPEQISLDVLKGNSKLQFIEINEEVLTEILELPTWLKIKKAYCTGVTVNVPWTRLKTSPIEIFIDEINVDVELSSGFTGKRGENPLGNYADSSSYGFANKVVENMSLYINTVEINFDSDVFGGSLMLSRLSVESRSPGWAKVKDLRQTRITCPTSNRTLMYKHLSWHLLRVEASAKSSKDEKRSKINASLRLITSGGKIRIALKKSSTDGAVIHARIQTILEDILWVATLPQLRSAISFASYIMDLVKKAQNDGVALMPVLAGQNRQSNAETPGAASTSTHFRTFYFDQTSYHLHVKKIDLHLCDDAHTSNCYPPEWNIESGAMQVTLFQVLIDAYPKSSATSDRFTWMNYQCENPIRKWMHTRLAQHYQEILNNTNDSTLRTRLERCWPQLMGFHLVVRMYDLTIQCVSDMSTKKDALKNLFVSERFQRGLPTDQHIIHFELANYFHPMTDTLPVPKAATYLQLGPFSLSFDDRTIRWCLYVAHSLSVVIEDNNFVAGIETDVETPDIRIELLMPKIILPLPNPSSDNRLPHRLVLSMSTLSISSCNFDGHHSVRFMNMTEEAVNKVTNYNKTNPDLFNNIRFQKDAPLKSEKFYLSTSPIWVETDHGPLTKGLTLVHDIPFIGAFLINSDNICAYTEATEEVTLMIDHFQFLQLTRMLETLSKFAEVLASDQKHFDESKSGKASTAPLVQFLVAVEKIRAHVILNMGSLPSPYDSCPAVTETTSSYMDRLSDVTAVTPRSNTPVMTRKADVLTVPKANLPRNATVENFPEFPRGPSDFDAGSVIDDSVSVATSVEDENNFDFEMTVNDDPFANYDVAEEAVTYDENVLNDRIFKSTMAKVGNILQVTVLGVTVVGKAHAGTLEVNGAVKGVELASVFNIVRQEAMELLKKNSEIYENGIVESQEIITFRLLSLPDTTTSYITADVKGLKTSIDDEILTHLSQFALDNQITENKVNLSVNVRESDISIVDRKKKKPLKLRIKSLVIEQEED